ncbi:MAG TPA: hypothetical protein VN673_08820 [Clostridia bacterium]|nr:hypothetical protein [Clostridia bacterium]
MMNGRQNLVTRFLGTIGWFYVGTVCSVFIGVTVVRLAYGQMQWGWGNLSGHLGVILGISIGLSFGPFSVFDLAERATNLVNDASKSQGAVCFSAGAVYPFLLLLVFAAPSMFMKSHGAMFWLLVLVFALTFLLPWLFVQYMARRVERREPPK